MSPDTEKFLELLKPEYNDALKYCKALCSRSSPREAEDVLQQSLLKSLENFDKLNDQSKFRSWFFKIITREFYNNVRKSFWKRFLPIENYDLAESFPEVYDDSESEERKVILNKALSSISDKERSSLLLFEIGGFSISEIKELQNERSISAVKSRLSRARKKLKQFLIKYESRQQLLNKSPESKQLSDKSEPKNSFIQYSGEIKNETFKLSTEADKR